MSDPHFKAEESMKGTIENLKNNFIKIRTGRATAAVLDGITIDYYGAETPVSQLVGVKNEEGHILVIDPWDKSILNAIEKALLKSDIGVTPQSDGTVLRLPFPAPSEERRKELVKDCREYAEEARIAVRNARRDANNELDREEKDGEISEDDNRREQNNIQTLTDKYIAEIDNLLKEKEEEVMEV